MRQIGIVGVFHGFDKLFSGHCLTVMTLKIQVGALAEAVWPQQCIDHTHHFSALFIHRGGIEVVDLDIGIGPNGMGHGAGILRELGATQGGNTVDSANRGRTHGSGKLLITQHRKPFLQAQLEPVTARHPITRPVVKIFVTNNRFNPLVTQVGSGVWPSQHTGGVENIQAFIFHGTHVEAFDRNNHKNVEIIFTAISLLVPLHGVFQGQHGVIHLVDIMPLGENLQLHLAATHGHKGVINVLQVTGHQRKQVSRFHKGVFPGHPVALALYTAGHIITV